MNTKTKTLSLAVIFTAMIGMIGITFDQAFASNGNGVGGVGKGGYQLNLIGQDRETEKSCDNNGHRIHVPLSGPYKILLSEGPFEVLDCNALDKDKTASFQLPDPTEGTNGCTDTTCDLAYQVWIRVLGQPGKTVTVGPTCATEAGGVDFDGDGVFDEEVCSTETIDVPSANNGGKGNGGAKFTNVSKELLTICANTDDDPACDIRVALFDDRLEDYLWNFDSDGARNTQLRFVVEPITVG